jgi:hypothetical protein
MKLIFTLLLSISFVTIHTSECNISAKLLAKTEKEIRKIHRYKQLSEAINLTESANNPKAIGKNGDIGLKQITSIRLKDFNQKTGKNYTTEDIFNPVIQDEIFDYYAFKIGIENHQKIARNWNGGQNGMRMKSTEKYWKKVCKNYQKTIGL